jgi:hypothetical protein
MFATMFVSVEIRETVPKHVQTRYFKERVSLVLFRKVYRVFYILVLRLAPACCWWGMRHEKHFGNLKAVVVH